VDIGANHPTKLSNTFYFYRRGWCGITVEPNREYEWLHRMFRPRDIFLGIGVGPEARLQKFHHQRAAVLSGFCKQSEAAATGCDYLPVLPLDALLPLVPDHGVDLLTVDVEGMNLEVLQSGPMVLKLTRLVIVEAGEQESALISLLSSNGFNQHPRTPHNLVFERAK